jgi:hypothetical protein
VLRSARQLEDLATNEAVFLAEALAAQLSSLAVAVEFPPLGPALPAVEYDQCKGAAGAMPLLQVGFRPQCDGLKAIVSCSRYGGGDLLAGGICTAWRRLLADYA